MGATETLLITMDHLRIERKQLNKELNGISVPSVRAKIKARLSEIDRTLNKLGRS